jgi:hypothetical protein
MLVLTRKHEDASLFTVLFMVNGTNGNLGDNAHRFVAMVHRIAFVLSKLRQSMVVSLWKVMLCKPEPALCDHAQSIARLVSGQIRVPAASVVAEVKRRKHVL